MSENLSSIRTSRDNLLRTKVKSFKDTYTHSLQRTQTKSSLTNLASTVYSKKFNKDFTPTKNKSLSNLSAKNPEHSPAIKGVDMRASHIPNMSDINTELLQNKRRLEERIMLLKDEIAKETRARNKAETNWRLLRNEKEACQNSYNQYCRRSDKLQEAITEVKNQNSQLNRDIKKLKNQNDETNAKKKHETEVVNELQQRVNFLKVSLLQEEKDRNYVKSELIKEQKVMDSCSILKSELENEKAMLMIEINRSVALNKL